MLRWHLELALIIVATVLPGLFVHRHILLWGVLGGCRGTMVVLTCFSLRLGGLRHLGDLWQPFRATPINIHHRGLFELTRGRMVHELNVVLKWLPAWRFSHVMFVQKQPLFELSQIVRRLLSEILFSYPDLWLRTVTGISLSLLNFVLVDQFRIIFKRRNCVGAVVPSRLLLNCYYCFLIIIISIHLLNVSILLLFAL